MPGTAPCHGERVPAFDPARQAGGNPAPHQARAEAMFEAITGQGTRLPSQRRYAARQRSATDGVRVPRALWDEVLALGT